MGYRMDALSDAVVASLNATTTRPEITYRLAGDRHVLVEYGPMVLDLNLTFRVYSLAEVLEESVIPGVREVAPGVRSLLIRYDPLEIPLPKLIENLKEIERRLESMANQVVASRRIVLPISYDDSAVREATESYMAHVRASAPYLPDNLAFVARANGLESKDQVIAYHQKTDYMVLGLGDVYLGAPCAVGLDPRYRLVAPKYNPARLWTYEGTVGIGGSYMCIYPMTSPGGYQMIGRTLKIWDTYQTTWLFEEAPYLLRPFDRLQFKAVDERTLSRYREQMAVGEYSLEIEESTFDLGQYNCFISDIADEVRAAKKRRETAIGEVMNGY